MINLISPRLIDVIRYKYINILCTHRVESGTSSIDELKFTVFYMVLLCCFKCKMEGPSLQ